MITGIDNKRGNIAGSKYGIFFVDATEDKSKAYSYLPYSVIAKLDESIKQGYVFPGGIALFSDNDEKFYSFAVISENGKFIPDEKITLLLNTIVRQITANRGHEKQQNDKNAICIHDRGFKSEKGEIPSLIFGSNDWYSSKLYDRPNMEHILGNMDVDCEIVNATSLSETTTEAMNCEIEEWITRRERQNAQARTIIDTIKNSLEKMSKEDREEYLGQMGFSFGTPEDAKKISHGICTDKQTCFLWDSDTFNQNDNPKDYSQEDDVDKPSGY